ncbi:unnamed protein product [Pylaiella littoralis]
MVGKDMLGLMSAQGRQAVEERSREPSRGFHLDVFGGLGNILVGDRAQLSPVGASSLWCPTPLSRGLCVQELRAWLAMNNAVELTQVISQLSPEQAASRDALLRITEGTQTEDDWNLLK